MQNGSGSWTKVPLVLPGTNFFVFDKEIVHENFDFVLDKVNCVQAEGQGNTLFYKCSPHKNEANLKHVLKNS